MRPDGKAPSVTVFLDTEYNAVYGILIAMWATVFVESWKRNEAWLRYYWDNNDEGQNTKEDEREEYHFYRFYNQVSDRV